MKLARKIILELNKLNADVELALISELSRDIELGSSGLLQFEIDPLDYRIHLVQTENDVLKSFELDESIEVQYEDEVDDIYEVVSEQIVSWFAERWKQVNGPSTYSPAYIFFHGGLDSSRYDLEEDEWGSVDKAWPNS